MRTWVFGMLVFSASASGGELAVLVADSHGAPVAETVVTVRGNADAPSHSEWLRWSGEWLHVRSWRNQRLLEGLPERQTDNQVQFSARMLFGVCVDAGWNRNCRVRVFHPRQRKEAFALRGASPTLAKSTPYQRRLATDRMS